MLNVEKYLLITILCTALDCVQLYTAINYTQVKKLPEKSRVLFNKLIVLKPVESSKFVSKYIS